MIFYSGFALENDQKLFESYLDQSAYTVAGFSYGAIEAFNHVLHTNQRVDRLQLFSPAFFQTKKERFKTMQLKAYEKDEQGYLNQFLKNCFSPMLNDESQTFGAHNKNQLETLLYYTWESKALQELKDKNIQIDVFLGEKDKIIDSKKAFEFFTPFATVYFHKEVGHFLLG